MQSATLLHVPHARTYIRVGVDGGREYHIDMVYVTTYLPVLMVGLMASTGGACDPTEKQWSSMMGKVDR